MLNFSPPTPPVPAGIRLIPPGNTAAAQFVIPRYCTGTSYPAGQIKGYGPVSVMVGTAATSSQSPPAIVVCEDYSDSYIHSEFAFDAVSAHKSISMPKLEDCSINGYDGGDTYATFLANYNYEGTASAGSATSVTLNTGGQTGSAVVGAYIGGTIRIFSGTGAGSTGVCTSYNATTKVVTCSGGWSGTSPAASSVVHIYGADQYNGATLRSSGGLFTHIGIANIPGTGLYMDRDAGGTLSVHSPFNKTSVCGEYLNFDACYRGFFNNAGDSTFREIICIYCRDYGIRLGRQLSNGQNLTGSMSGTDTHVYGMSLANTNTDYIDENYRRSYGAGHWIDGKGIIVQNIDSEDNPCTLLMSGELSCVTNFKGFQGGTICNICMMGDHNSVSMVHDMRYIVHGAFIGNQYNTLVNSNVTSQTDGSVGIRIIANNNGFSGLTATGHYIDNVDIYAVGHASSYGIVIGGQQTATVTLSSPSATIVIYNFGPETLGTATLLVHDSATQRTERVGNVIHCYVNISGGENAVSDICEVLRFVSSDEFGCTGDFTYTGAASAGDATHVTLSTGSPSGSDSFYNGQKISILAGTSAGSTGICTGYVGSTKIAQVASWSAGSPGAGSTSVKISPVISASTTGTGTFARDGTCPLTNCHIKATVQGAGAGAFDMTLGTLVTNNFIDITTINSAGAVTLPSGYAKQMTNLFTGVASGADDSTHITLNTGGGTGNGADDYYNGATITVVSGTGIGGRSVVTDYVGTTKVATVAPAWGVTPDNTSHVRIDTVLRDDSPTNRVWINGDKYVYTTP